MSKTVNGVDVSPYVMKLSGKEYLQVQGRLVLLRSLHPDWSIETELVKLDVDNTPEDFAMFQATIYNGDGRAVATAYGSETRKGFPTGHIEKAETIAVGRALLFAGIGIQYAEKGTEEDGGAKLADTPAPAKTPAAKKPDADTEAKGTKIRQAIKETNLSPDTVVAMAARIFKGRAIESPEDVKSKLTLEEVDQLVAEMRQPA